MKHELDAADAIVVGAGAGLSASAGFDYGGERFRRNFAAFERAYGFHDMYSGGFYPYRSPEAYWAFWSRMILLNRYEAGAGEPYRLLLRLLQGRDYFVLTTNVDHQFQKAGFDKERLFYTQGDYGLFQCSEPCCQQTYDNEALIRQMAERQENLQIPGELLPRCPVCGRPMTMNLRCDDRFVQDAGWDAAAARYQAFLDRTSESRVVYWELGVGMNTPVFCSSSTRDNPMNIRLKQQISGFSSNKQKDLKKGGVRNVWQKNVKSRKHAGLYQQAA